MIQQTLYEVSPYRESVLKEIDNAFYKLKNDKNNIQNKRELVKLIKKFTGIDHIFFSIKKDMINAYVIPIYKGILFKTKNLKTIKKLLEDDKKKNVYIDKIYIVFGDKLIDKFSPRELTSILLHELGHVYQHSSHLFDVLKKTINFGSIFLTLSLVGILPALLMMRSLTFLDHFDEYDADKFTIKYGYGDETIKVLNKLNFLKNKKRSYDVRDIFLNLIKIIIGSTHPSNSKRICKVAKESFKKYKNLYPKQSKELTVILNNFNCKI